MASEKIGPMVKDQPLGEDSSSTGPASDPPQPPAKPGVLDRIRSHFVGGGHFYGEIIGLVGSGLALVSIAVVMKYFDGKELPNWHTWGDFRFTINSLLAIIYTVGLTCAMIPISGGLSQLKYIWFVEKDRSLADLDTFDAATRGKLGSAKLLWRLRFKHLGVLGALGSLIALAYGPFVQNSIVIELHREPGKENSTVSYLQSYGKLIQEINGTVADVDSVVKYYAEYSLLDADSAWPYPISRCATGDCQWPYYVTLAVCSRCQNITKDLIFDPANPENVSLSNGFSFLNKDNSRSNVFAMSATHPAMVFKEHKLPLALVHSILAYNRSMYENGNMSYLRVKESSLSPADMGGRIYPYTVDSNNTEWSAHECVLYPCVQMQLLSSTVTTDPIGQKAPNTVIQIRAEEDYRKTLTVENLSENYTVNPDTLHATVNFDFANSSIRFPDNFTSLDRDHLYPPEQPFEITGPAYRSLRSFLGRLLTGVVWNGLFKGEISLVGGNPDTADGMPPPDQPQTRDTKDAMNSIFYNSAEVMWYQNDCNGSLPSAGDVDCAMMNLALGLTNAMRESVFKTVYLEDRKAINGTTLYLVQICRAAWPYISVPIAVWVLGAALVTGTIWKTRRARLNTWRASPLAMLLLSLDTQGLAHLRDWQNLDDEGLRELAASVRLRLKVGENGAPIFVGGETEGNEGSLAKNIV